jgi:hypothetical protein
VEGRLDPESVRVGRVGNAFDRIELRDGAGTVAAGAGKGGGVEVGWLGAQQGAELQDAEAVHLEQVYLNVDGPVAALVTDAAEDDDIAAHAGLEACFGERVEDFGLDCGVGDVADFYPHER